MFKPDKIVIHHSLTKDGREVSWGAIRWFHMHDPKYMFTNIGYHGGIELVASGEHEFYEVLYGRPWDIQGAHCPAVNATSLGFCFVGNYDLIAPPEPMLDQGARFLAEWCRLLAMAVESILPHSQFEPKTCPGTAFDMDALRGKVLDYL